MAWVKVDDQLYVHENRWEVGLEGMGFYLVMLCYCNHRLTDGFVSDSFVESNMPRPDRRGTLKKLIATGMIVRVPGGYEIPGYHKYQPTKAEVIERRAKRAEAGRKGADRKWSSPEPSTLCDGKTDGKTHGKRAA